MARTNITELVELDEGALTLTTRGWTGASKVAAQLDGQSSDSAQWAALFNFSQRKLAGDDNWILFFLSITRKIANGDILPRKEIDVDI